MATAFDTDTINQPDAGSVGLSMVEKIRDNLVAHAAWDLVEEFTPGSGTVRWYVFKCLASVSGLPNDFFVVIGRTIGSGELRMVLCEAYNSGTHTMSFMTAPSQTTSYTYDSSGRHTATYVLSTTTFTNAGVHVWAPSGVSTKYWMIITDDSFSVAFNGASNGFFHVGAYTPLSSVAISMPVCSCSHDQNGYIVRNPVVASVSAAGAALWAYAGGSTSITLGTNYFPLGFMGRLDANDKLQGDQRPVAEMGIVLNTWPSAQAAAPIMGWALGKHKHIRTGLSGSSPAGVAFGDAYVLQSRLWVPYLPTDPRIWDTGVAA